MTNAKEQKIIDDAKKAVQKYEHSDDRDGGTYFESTCVKNFQKLAKRTAEVIGEQGAENTAAPLVNLAKELQKIPGKFMDHGNTLGFAFKKGLKDAVKPDNKKNPFKSMNL